MMMAFKVAKVSLMLPLLDTARILNIRAVSVFHNLLSAILQDQTAIKSFLGGTKNEIFIGQ